MWNSSPQSIQVLPTHTFKASLHERLLHILKYKDSYVNTPTLKNKVLGSFSLFFIHNRYILLVRFPQHLIK